MSLVDLTNLAKARLEDAELLNTHGRYDSAQYLCGYAVELALKTRICKTLKMYIHLNNYIELGKEIEKEKGEFTLYALLERENNPNRWDILMAAPWVGEGSLEETRYVVERMSKVLSPEERTAVSQIALLRPDEPVVQEILQRYTPVDRSTGIFYPPLDNIYLNGILILRGYVLFNNAYQGPLGKIMGA
jgi:HEPN domain-containing protein